MAIYQSGTLIANRYEVVQGPREKPSLAGGMGLVYLCVDHAENDHPVALKTFRPELLPDRSARDRFLREGTTWMQLGKHPHIVCCNQVLKADIGPEVLLVLELIAAAEGKFDASLRTWLTIGKPLSVEQALLFALHITRGMKFATTKIPYLVHRDLKPENVLVGRDGFARITDFGLATVFQVASSHLKITDAEEIGEASLVRTQLTRDIVGTPLYMPPEQWAGAELDARADIYAFGCILYEMIVGEFAVFERNLGKLEKAHRSGQIKIPSELNKHVIPLLKKCITTNRAERYQNWSEVEAEVANVYKITTGKDAPKLMDSLSDTRAERIASGWSYNNMGLSYRDIGKFEVAVKYFELALDVSRIEKEPRLEALTLTNLGNVFLQMEKVHQAISAHEQGLVIAREINDRDAEGRLLNNLGNAYKILDETDRAIEFFEMRLTIAREINDRLGEENALCNLGSVYSMLGDTHRAISFYKHGLDIAIEIRDRHGQGMALIAIGNALHRLDDVRSTIWHLEQGLAIMHEIGNPHDEATALRGLSDACSKSGDYQQAIHYSGRLLDIARECNDQRGEWKSLRDLGYAYVHLYDYPQAIEFFEQAISLAHRINDTMGAARDCLSLALVLLHTNRLIEALQKAEYALQVFTEVGHKDYAASAQKLINRIRAKLS